MSVSVWPQLDVFLLWPLGIAALTAPLCFHVHQIWFSQQVLLFLDDVIRYKGYFDVLAIKTNHKWKWNPYWRHSNEANYIKGHWDIPTHGGIVCYHTVSKAVFWLRLKIQRTAQSDVNAALAFSLHHSCVTGDVTALQQISQTPHLSATLGALFKFCHSIFQARHLKNRASSYLVCTLDTSGGTEKWGTT